MDEDQMEDKDKMQNQMEDKGKIRNQMGDKDKIRNQWTPCVHEEEYFQHEHDLLKKEEDCEKNRGHQKFISVSDFKLENLPGGRRDELVWELIQTVIFLTVRVVVRHTSTDRPDDYADAELRGLKWGRSGSGLVSGVSWLFTEEDGETCPCTECLQKPSDQRKTKWGGFEVETASHVIFDDTECKKSRCDVGFDRDEDKDNCSKLYGVKVLNSNIKEDWCCMLCVTHDENVYNKMEEMVRRFDDLRDRLWDKHEKQRLKTVRYMSELLVICVSHPHGMRKKVTLGRGLDMETVEPRKWSYATPTCPGSSGAPVFIVGTWNGAKLYSRRSTHSGCYKAGENECGRFGWSRW